MMTRTLTKKESKNGIKVQPVMNVPYIDFDNFIGKILIVDGQMLEVTDYDFQIEIIHGVSYPDGNGGAMLNLKDLFYGFKLYEKTTVDYLFKSIFNTGRLQWKQKKLYRK